MCGIQKCCEVADNLRHLGVLVVINVDVLFPSFSVQRFSGVVFRFAVQHKSQVVQARRHKRIRAVQQLATDGQRVPQQRLGGLGFTTIPEKKPHIV